MPQKDHYQILQITNKATATEIKKAFRKLALIHHPDKKQIPAEGSEKFNEILEAYLILSDKKQKAQFDLSRISNRSKDSVFIYANDPATLILMAEKLHKKLSDTDPFRTDHDWLFGEMDQLVSKDHLAIIVETDEEVFKKQFIELILTAAAYLQHIPASIIANRLLLINNIDDQDSTRIKNFLKHSAQKSIWEKYKVWLALVVAISICMLIYLITN